LQFRDRSESGTRERGMTTNLHIVRKALICGFLSIVLTAELTILGALRIIGQVTWVARYDRNAQNHQRYDADGMGR